MGIRSRFGGTANLASYSVRFVPILPIKRAASAAASGFVLVDNSERGRPSAAPEPSGGQPPYPLTSDNVVPAQVPAPVHFAARRWYAEPREHYFHTSRPAWNTRGHQSAD